MPISEQQEATLTREIANAYYNRGNYYYSDAFSVTHIAGVCEKAIADLQKAIEVNPKHIEARYLLVEIYRKEKRKPDTAKKYLDEIAEIQGTENDRESLRKIAREFEKLGDQEKANEFFIKAGRIE